MCSVEVRVSACNAFEKPAMCRGKSVADCFVNNILCQQSRAKENNTE